VIRAAIFCPEVAVHVLDALEEEEDGEGEFCVFAGSSYKLALWYAEETLQSLRNLTQALSIQDVRIITSLLSSGQKIVCHQIYQHYFKMIEMCRRIRRIE
jgi:hypothetical protein